MRRTFSQKNSGKSNEATLIRGALFPTLSVGILGIVVATLFRGSAGFYGALLAQLVVVMYFTVHLAVSAISRKLDPMSTFALAIFSYFAKIAVLGFFLWALTNFTSRDSIDRPSFGLVAVALTVAWLGGEIRSFLKLEIHLPLPSASPSPSPSSSTLPSRSASQGRANTTDSADIKEQE